MPILIPLALFASLTLAIPTTESASTTPQPIKGGEEVPSCGWPSVAKIGTDCTGTLIHPRILLTTARCISGVDEAPVRFGETVAGATTLADTERCRPSPGWIDTTSYTQGEDYGYCLLKEPVTQIPIIPVASGCEQDAIVAGARIMHVGLGLDENGESGRKKMLDTTITAVTPVGELTSGTDNQLFCTGDSGGPVFVYLDPADGGDGSWRVAAIQSWYWGSADNPDCREVTGSVLVSQAIDWIEEDSGIDITPCTDDSVWSPGAHCGGVPLEPWMASGTYAAGCTPDGDVVEFAATCGPGLDAMPDTTPPVVAFAAPASGIELGLRAGESTVPVEIEITATDEGWGVEEVELAIRSVRSGQQQVEARDEWHPWVWSAELAAGPYELVAVATDHAGNASEPVTVCFGIDEPGCQDVEGETESSGSGGVGLDESTGGVVDSGDPGTGGEESTDGGDAASLDDDDASGCGCRSHHRPSATAAMLLILGLLGGRRRRRPGAALSGTVELDRC